MNTDFEQKKALVFDWSGTLSNDFEVFTQTCAIVFRELGRTPLTAKEIRATFRTPYMRFWNTHFPDLSLERQCLLYEAAVHRAGEPSLHEGVFETLRTCARRGFELGVVSSNPYSKLSLEVKDSGIEDLFSCVVGDVHDKTDAIISFIESTPCKPQDVYYIGDSDGDIMSGKKAGVRTIGITWGFQSRELLEASKPDYIVDDIRELLTLPL